jgi:uncharacterized membrane protein YiaA
MERIGMVGAIVLLAGVCLQITHWVAAPYIYLVGALAFSYVQVVHDRYEGRNFVIKRLRRQQIFGAIALILAGVFMFTLRHNEWIVCLTVAALLELYTSFRIPQELEKEK